jgi:nuclear GTP-binding protein
MGDIDLKLNAVMHGSENDAPALIAPEEADEIAEDDREIKTQDMGQNSRRAYLRELRRVAEAADVVLHVLDARDPIGTRSTAVEEMVAANYRKRLVYVLNKADLVPRSVLLGWMNYLKRSHPVIPFKSNTQNQKSNLGRTTGKISKEATTVHTSQAVGVEELLGLLKNYARAGGDAKTSISVGIVGYPNVGKSSLINSLVRSRVVGVSPNPGFTKQMQEVILDKNIRLLDSPGIVFADGDSIATALRNCVSVEELLDVYTPIQAILEKCPAAYLMQLYSIPRFKEGDFMGFLALVARATGKLKKGGVPNVDAAARSIIHDWNEGKIKYYCMPPEISEEPRTGGVIRGGEVLNDSDSKILDTFSKELCVDDLARGVIGALETYQKNEDESDFVEMDTVAPTLHDVTDIADGADAKGKAGSSKIKSTGLKKKTGSKTKVPKKVAGAMEEAYDFEEVFSK